MENIIIKCIKLVYEWTSDDSHVKWFSYTNDWFRIEVKPIMHDDLNKFYTFISGFDEYFSMYYSIVADKWRLYINVWIEPYFDESNWITNPSIEDVLEKEWYSYRIK